MKCIVCRDEIEGGEKGEFYPYCSSICSEWHKTQGKNPIFAKPQKHGPKVSIEQVVKMCNEHEPYISYGRMVAKYGL